MLLGRVAVELKTRGTAAHIDTPVFACLRWGSEFIAVTPLHCRSAPACKTLQRPSRVAHITVTSLLGAGCCRVV